MFSGRSRDWRIRTQKNLTADPPQTAFKTSFQWINLGELEAEDLVQFNDLSSFGQFPKAYHPRNLKEGAGKGRVSKSTPSSE